MKTPSTKKRAQRKPKPALKWQTGEYARYAQFKLMLPYQFLLLCRLVDKTPAGIIRDFTYNLACESGYRQERDIARQHLINYFIAHGYGQQHYTEQDLRDLFKEMDAVSLLFPKQGKMKLINLYANWRDNIKLIFLKNGSKSPGANYLIRGKGEGIGV